MSTEIKRDSLTDAQLTALHCVEELKNKVYAPLLSISHKVDTSIASLSEQNGDISIIQITYYGVSRNEIDLVVKETEDVVQSCDGQLYDTPGIITKSKYYEIFSQTNKYSFGIDPEDEEDEPDYQSFSDFDF